MMDCTGGVCERRTDMSEQDIARYKHIFDEILRMTDDGFIVVDTNGIVTDINDQ